MTAPPQAPPLPREQPQPSPEESLQVLYTVARRLPLPADAHDDLRVAHDRVAQALAAKPGKG